MRLTGFAPSSQIRRTRLVSLGVAMELAAFAEGLMAPTGILPMTWASTKEELMGLEGPDGPQIPLDPDIEFGGGETEPHGHQRRARRAEATIVVALAFGGVLGAVSRYAVSLALPTETARFPWGTFLINVSGSAALGFILVLVIEQFPRARLQGRLSARVSSGRIRHFRRTRWKQSISFEAVTPRRRSPMWPRASSLGSWLYGSG